jgi:hypothetical protein
MLLSPRLDILDITLVLQKWISLRIEINFKRIFSSNYF